MVNFQNFLLKLKILFLILLILLIQSLGFFSETINLELLTLIDFFKVVKLKAKII